MRKEKVTSERLEEDPYVRACPLFSGLPDEELTAALVLLQARRQRYARQAFLHRAGEPLTAFGLVLRGTVRVCTDDLTDEPMLMSNVTPGGTFGESLCYLAIPASPVYIYTPEGAELLWLNALALRHADPADPMVHKMQDRFTATLAARALTMNDRIQILSKLTLREKLNTFFAEWAQRTGADTFTVPFDRASLAAYLGVNRASLSRELSLMQQQGLISYYRSSFKLHRKRPRE